VPDQTPAPASIGTPKTLRPPSPIGNGKIPVPEVLAELPDDGPRREPPSSTWFDDLDSGPTPLAPAARKRPDA